jgi:ATP/maltotriose-dependent transcriptional regulator MalT
VEVARELTGNRGVFSITLPASRTLVARLRRASSSFVVGAAVAEVERTLLETRRRISELETANARLVEMTERLKAEAELRGRTEAALRAVESIDTVFAARLERVGQSWQLSTRHVEIVALVVRGIGNKDIAGRLGCATHTVELHMTEVLRRSRQQSRSALIAAFWSDA